MKTYFASLKIDWIVTGKILLALLLLSALVLIAARSIAPGLDSLHVLLYVAGGAACFLVAISLSIVVVGAFNQWALNRGATDAQWFIFPRSQEPPGLESLHGQAISEPAGGHDISASTANAAAGSDQPAPP
ncbi:hypothetical protein [Variovorax sp. ZT4R33]|uniref:hypothetical protein n=1 Tax=Variovorax sp. ZT4R33 TaxID=3443743 RepID=UPI003F488610